MKKIIQRPLPVATASALALVLSACGGGGGDDSLAAVSPTSPVTGGGIGGSGQTTSGTIDGFGSIFVNGVRFDTDDAEVTVDGDATNDDALRLGMVVVVSGSIDDDGINGTAESVRYDSELKGPIASIEPSLDDDSKLLVILGTQVIIERSGTVFDDITFDTLAVGDLVEVSGFTGRGDSLRATRLEREADFVEGQSAIQVRGTVGTVTGSQFILGEFTVDFGSASLVDIPNSTVSAGQWVRIRGTLTGTVITATRIERDDGISDDFDDDDDVSVQGSVTGFVSLGDFLVNGVPVDASGALVQPTGVAIVNGSIVEVEGRWNGSTLIADELELRRGRIKVEAPVAAINTETGTITLQTFPGTVEFVVDARTRLDDDTDRVGNLTLADIVAGDFLEVEAYLDGDRLIATTIDREDDDDNEHTVRGPVESFRAGLDITILGLTYSTSGAEFEGRDDNSISADDFYNALQIGDLIEIDDDNADGIADEVEYEDADVLPGELEFVCRDPARDDDCDDSDDDDSSDDDSSDDDSSDDDSSVGG